MKKNPLLYLALVSSRIGGGLLCLALLFVIGCFVHWHLDPAYYKSVQISVEGGSISLYEGETLHSKSVSGRDIVSSGNKAALSTASCGKRFYVNELASVSVYTSFLQVVLSIILSGLMIREIIKILKSVREERIFTASNVNSFRLLGWLCLAMSALNSIRIMATAQNSTVSFNPGFSLLLFMVAAFIMAEIFKEGYRLSEQDRLTI
ncbi:DUF2975 domain-containing protein [uncultured Hymenobacter sp.]|uniref:DUF2975 domain-containing protein n=1 Tax=uncultured Hymenobacter sp. TaxID=170016 RepID=UPI0035CA2B2D